MKHLITGLLAATVLASGVAQADITGAADAASVQTGNAGASSWALNTRQLRLILAGPSVVAANTPQEWRGPPHMNEPEIALLEAGVKGQAKKSGRGIPWYLFKVGAANAIILSHIAANATEYTLTQWAPTFFIEQHGVSPAQLGQFLALPQTAAFAATFVTAALEDLALRSGMALLGSAQSRHQRA